MTERDVFLKLKHVQYTARALERLRREREWTEEHAAAIRGLDYSKVRVQTSSAADVGKIVERIWDKVSAICAEIAKETEALLAAEEEARALIALCESEIRREILTERYILGVPWPEISKKHGYVPRRIFQIRKAAFQEIAAKTFH